MDTRGDNLSKNKKSSRSDINLKMYLGNVWDLFKAKKTFFHESRWMLNLPPISKKKLPIFSKNGRNFGCFFFWSPEKKRQTADKLADSVPKVFFCPKVFPKKFVKSTYKKNLYLKETQLNSKQMPFSNRMSESKRELYPG